MKKLRYYLAIILVIIAMVCYLIPLNSCNNSARNGGDNGPQTNSLPAFYTSIIASHPHDTTSFTEGFLVYNGSLYESTGDPDYVGKSRLQKIDLNTWKAEKQIGLDKKYFGEGIAILHDTIYQMTYREHTLFMYDMSFRKLKEQTFDTETHEGWGMTTDGTNLIVSDGSSSLQYFAPSTFTFVKKVTVSEQGMPISNVNELEWIDGYIYANQYELPYILKIDPSTGAVVAKSDISSIVDQVRKNEPWVDVVNGIAYDSKTKKIYITGKYWSQVYEVAFQ
jgi:glutamine cyclotransferase